MSRDFYLDYIRAQIRQDRERCARNNWHFNVRGPDNCTIGDLVSAIMAIDNTTDAKRFYDGYLAVAKERTDLDRPAEEIVKANIGWCFGEGMSSERIAMWVETTDSAHPIFGTMLTRPTLEEAFEAGLALGQEADRE